NTGETCDPVCASTGAPCKKPTECDKDLDKGLCGELYDASLLEDGLAAVGAAGEALALPRDPIMPASAGVCQLEQTPPQATCSPTDTCDTGECVTYAMEAFSATDLESLTGGSPQVLTVLVPELVVNRDVNGDGDKLDLVAEMYDRQTGRLRPLDGSEGF